MQGEEGRPLSPTLLTTWRSYALLKSHGPLNFEYFVILVVWFKFPVQLPKGKSKLPHRGPKPFKGELPPRGFDGVAVGRPPLSHTYFKLNLIFVLQSI